VKQIIRSLSREEQISIVVILLSIMLGSIVVVRDWDHHKRGRICQQNLREIHKALTVYADDNDGWLPPSGAIAQGFLRKTLSRETLCCPSEKEPLPFYYGYRQDIPGELGCIVSPDNFPYIMDSKGHPWWEVAEDTKGDLFVSAGGQQPWEYATRHSDRRIHVCFVAGNINSLCPKEFELILKARQALPSETYSAVAVGNDGFISKPEGLVPGRYKLVPIN